MQAAPALIVDGPAPRQRRESALPWVLLGSAAAHLLVLAALATGVHPMPPMVDPPTITMQLLDPATPPDPVEARREPAPPPAKASPVARPAGAPTLPAPSRILSTPPVAMPAAPAGAVAPPGFRARGLTGGGEALREAARSGIGCRNAEDLALTREQRATCDEALGEKNKNRPAMYAVIDPDKKAAFDRTCKKDDDWCLYRTGKGPYPGILALGRKKKIKGWD